MKSLYQRHTRVNVNDDVKSKVTNRRKAEKTTANPNGMMERLSCEIEKNYE